MVAVATTVKTRLFKLARTGFVYLLIFSVAGFLGNLWMSRNQASGIAPPIVAQNLQGQPTRVELDSGKPLLIYFFADWCPICRAQNGAIEWVSEYYPVVAIAMQSGSLDNVRRYVEAQGLKLEVLNDARGDISRAYGVAGVPASFIVDAQGNIRYSTRGYATAMGLLVRLWLAG